MKTILLISDLLSIVKKKAVFIFLIFTASNLCAQTVPGFYYCSQNVDIWTEGFRATDNNAGYGFYKADIQELNNLNIPIPPLYTYTYTAAQGVAGGPALGSLAGLKVDKKYQITFSVKNLIGDPWSAPGPVCSFNTVNKRQFLYCGSANVNINADGTEASDNNVSYQYYRFEFSQDATFSEHAVIGSPLSNKYSIELNPSNKSTLVAPALDNIMGLQYLHSYYARVKVKEGLPDPWSLPGPVCTFTTYCPGTPITPKYYWQMEPSQKCTTMCNTSGNDDFIDAIRSQELIAYPSISMAPGQVGFAKQQNLFSSSASYGYCTVSGTNCVNYVHDYSNPITSTNGTSSTTLTKGLTFEYLIKPDQNKSWTTFLVNCGSNSLGGTLPYFYISPYGVAFNLYDNTNNLLGAISTQFGLFPGFFSSNYLVDGNWHHLAFVYNGTNARMQVWIDGKLSPYLDIPTTTTGSGQVYFPNDFAFGTTVASTNFEGAWDEFAAYNVALPPEMIYQHYQDMLKGNHYNYCTNYTLADLPAQPQPVCLPLSSNNFAPTGILQEVQLKSFPLPRYHRNNGLKPNFPWADIRFLSLAPTTTTPFPSFNNARALDINLERAKKWNYYLELLTPSFAANNAGVAGSMADSLVKQANANPNFPSSTIIYRNWNTAPASVNASNPTSSTSATTLNGMNAWGDSVASNNVYMNLVKYMSRPLQIINEDDESFVATVFDGAPWMLPTNTCGQIQYKLDSAYVKGLLNMSNYPSFTNVIQNTQYSKYRETGFNPHEFPDWKYTRNNTAWKHSTIDIYPQTPKFWYTGGLSGGNGFYQYEKGRANEITLGDNLSSPFVSAGWSVNEAANLRPAQYLGLLKAIGILGAEFYYVGYFNECQSKCKTVFDNGTSDVCTATTCAWPNATYSYTPRGTQYVIDPGGPNDPAGYIYQIAMPSYAQAITSRYEHILRNSFLTQGINAVYYNTTQFSYTLGNKLVFARQYTPNNNLFIIYGSIMQYNNCTGIEPDEEIQNINLSGYSGPPADELTFKIRRQGSTYVYDRRTPGNFIFYQLDRWHENTYPYYWNKNFNIEAELYDNNNNISNNYMSLKTEVPVGAIFGDYTNFTTYIHYPTGSNKKSEYDFEPRNPTANGTKTYYVWLRARATATAPGGLSKINVTISVPGFPLIKKTMPCIDNTGFKWYSFAVALNVVGASPSTFTFTAKENKVNKITFTGNIDVEFDQFILSEVPTPSDINPLEIAATCASSNRTEYELNKEDQSQKISTLIYPNPNGGEFALMIDNTSEENPVIETIEIFDTQGQLIYKNTEVKSNDKGIKIHVPGINDGVYILVVKINGQTIRHKVIIVN
ncbi:MAG TPA: T9SS type A sorting domain-containing protein [Bacteroidia bacterium]|jgi:hypothetical protein|nr:T9SS type A sorting domain-containing protein [Bacteroidia bacterium]